MASSIGVARALACVAPPHPTQPSPNPLQATKSRSRSAPPSTPATAADAAAAAATPQPAAQQAQRAPQAQQRGGVEEGQALGREASTRQARLVEEAGIGRAQWDGLTERTFAEQLVADRLTGEPRDRWVPEFGRQAGGSAG